MYDFIRFAGGLLGQWCVWTRKSVELLEEIKQLRAHDDAVPFSLFRRAQELTDANAAIFDARTSFSGVIPGVHEVLRRQGLLETRRCIDPDLDLSPGQKEEIDRVEAAYPHLRDDAFVAEHLEEWLS
jgi:dihydrodipicolinate synthase/N-acetylneuraminate lyase